MTLQKTPLQLTQEKLRKAQRVAKKPQTLPTAEERIKATIAARKLAESEAKTQVIVPRVQGMVTQIVSTKTLENHNYKISEESILEVLNATIRNQRNLTAADATQLSIKINMNHNSVRIISEHAYRLINPEYTGTLSGESSQRYIDVMERALNLK